MTKPRRAKVIDSVSAAKRDMGGGGMGGRSEWGTMMLSRQEEQLDGGNETWHGVHSQLKT